MQKQHDFRTKEKPHILLMTMFQHLSAYLLPRVTHHTAQWDRFIPFSIHRSADSVKCTHFRWFHCCCSPKINAFGFVSFSFSLIEFLVMWKNHALPRDGSVPATIARHMINHTLTFSFLLVKLHQLLNCFSSIGILLYTELH